MFDRLKKHISIGASPEAFDEEFNITFIESGGFTSVESDLSFFDDIDPEDKYVKWFNIKMCVDDDCQQREIGEIVFCAHYLSDFMEKYNEPALWLIDDTSSDQEFCSRILSKRYGIDFDRFQAVAYLDAILINDQYKDLGIEEEIVRCFDKIFWMFVRRELDLVFGISSGDNEHIPRCANIVDSYEVNNKIWAKVFTDI